MIDAIESIENAGTSNVSGVFNSRFIFVHQMQKFPLLGEVLTTIHF